MVLFKLASFFYFAAIDHLNLNLILNKSSSIFVLDFCAYDFIYYRYPPHHPNQYPFSWPFSTLSLIKIINFCWKLSNQYKIISQQIYTFFLSDFGKSNKLSFFLFFFFSSCLILSSSLSSSFEDSGGLSFRLP